MSQVHAHQVLVMHGGTFSDSTTKLFAVGQLLGFNFTNIVVSLYHFNINVFSKASVDLTGRKMVLLKSTIPIFYQ